MPTTPATSSKKRPRTTTRLLGDEVRPIELLDAWAKIDELKAQLKNQRWTARALQNASRDNLRLHNQISKLIGDVQRRNRAIRKLKEELDEAYGQNQPPLTAEELHKAGINPAWIYTR